MMANLIGSSYSTTVASSCEVIWKPPSPQIAQTVDFGGGELGADRRRHLEAHRAEAAGGDEAVRLVDPEVLRRPHLVLADAGDVVGVAPETS